MSMAFYRPPFKHVEVVSIDIDANPFDVKRRLLGTNAVTIHEIVDSIGNKYNLRMRLRGQGSGFYEGAAGHELPEPLHFNVSAETEQLLHTAVEKLKEHISVVKKEFVRN
jgi:hypothetical protein